MSISAALVMELRSATGAGMMDCKKALEESGGDMGAAKDYLRKKGIAIAQKKASRDTREGAIAIQVAPDHTQAAMVQLACETDFVARNENFQALLNQLCGQVLAQGDSAVSEQRLVQGKGTVGELITESIGKLGENVQLVEAVRLALSGGGVIGAYVHSNSKIGVLVALRAPKGAAGDKLTTLAKDLSMHIAASQVSAISAEQIDPAVLAKEKEIFMAQARESGKPEAIADKMVQGRLSKFVKEVTLLDQPFVKDPDKTIGQLLAEAGKGLGAPLAVERFIKFQF
jgi:elongation factor Ts